MPPARPGDEHAEKRRPLRAGYAGHITQISNHLIQVANGGHTAVRGQEGRGCEWLEAGSPLQLCLLASPTAVLANLSACAPPPHPLQLRAAMEGDERWQAYVRERLEPRNAEESVFAWKCGRPTVHEPEADMFQTELDFGSIDAEAFTRDVYQRCGSSVLARPNCGRE